MKKSLRTLTVNLQQGFFLTDDNQIIAAYSHNHQTVLVAIPNRRKDYVFPSNFKDYTFYERLTDNFSIDYWDGVDSKRKKL